MWQLRNPLKCKALNIWFQFEIYNDSENTFERRYERRTSSGRGCRKKLRVKLFSLTLLFITSLVFALHHLLSFPQHHVPQLCF